MISLEEFAERLLRIGAGWQPRPFPRRRRDRDILMKSFVMTLDPDASYAEAEINREIERWREEVVPALETDHVTIRRHLVDYGMLERTRDGRRYQVGFPARPVAFDLEVEELDQRATVAAYRAAHPRRRGPPPESDPPPERGPGQSPPERSSGQQS